VLQHLPDREILEEVADLGFVLTHAQRSGSNT
jgi:hypothetical protein